MAAPIRLEVLRLIKELQQELGFALLFITHYHQEASFMANRIYTLHQGKLALGREYQELAPRNQEN